MLALACFAALAITPARTRDVAAELARFSSALAEVRSGAERSGAELQAAATTLCEQFERCDARDVASYYLALTVEQRAQGLAAEARWMALRDEIVAAGAAGLGGAEWFAQRTRIVADLRALASDALAQPDFVPAARALTLVARLEVERVEADRALDDAGREQALARAAEDARRANELFERAGHLTPRLETEWVLARIAAARDDGEAARRGFERGYELATRVRNDDFREHSLRGLAGLARAAGNVRDEQRTLERIATFRDPRESWPLARDWSARLVHDDHAEQAVEFLDDHAPNERAHALDRVEWDLLRGSALLRLDDLEGAREHFERVAQGAAPELAVLALASLALRERREFEVLDLLGDDARIAKFSELGRQQAHALRGEALLTDGEIQPAIDELSLALALAEAWERAQAPPGELERNTAEGAAGSVIGERLGLHTIALLALANAKEGRDVEALRVIEDSQARTLREHARVTAEDVVAWARHFELGLVTWVVGADFTVAAHAFVDERGELSVACERIERGRTSLQEAARRLREAALADDRARTQRLSAEICASLWPPSLLEHLRAAARLAGDDPRLLWLAHGPLEELPIELLDLDDACGREVCSLALPGLPEARPGDATNSAESARWTLIGAPVDANGRHVLPGARDELAQLAELWPDANLYAGAVATRERLLAALADSRALHIATHLIPECERENSRYAPSSLLASNGERLCVHAIAAARPRAPLVVLSACSTGGGEHVDAEGLQGLARAFLASGTRNLVVTLWPVEDGAAADFARAFHSALKAGASPSRASRFARDELRSAGFGPADWAPFRALGRD